MTTQLDAPAQARAGTTPAALPGSTRHDTISSALLAAAATTLSTLAVASLLSGTRWLMHALGAILVVLAVGAAARAVRFPRPAVVLAQLTVCVGYVTAFYAGPVAVLGVFPGPGAVERLRDRVDAASIALNGVTPPFTPGNDIAMLAVAGVIGTAIAVDALSVSYRRPLLAGVPLLALYAVPASAMADGPRAWLFALPALGLLLLFVGDDCERLARWGLLGDRADLVRSGARKTGLRIGLCVLAVALIVPALVSTGTGDLFEDKGIGRQESPPITTLDPLVEMRRSLVRRADVDVLKVVSDTGRPEEQYLRAVTLDEFTGEQWRASDRALEILGPDLPVPPGLSAAVLASPVNSTISGLPEFRADYLPLPYPATRLLIEGNWRLDPLTGNVLSAEGREQAAGRDFVVDGLDLYPKAENVGARVPADPSMEKYLALPNLPKKVTDTARKVTAGKRGPLEIGIRLQSWFRNPLNFTYDLRPVMGSGSDAIVDFLNRRRGYCEHFAATMAVMARSLGVPARVNVGYTSGETTGGGSRTVSAWDAHAWPELYLPDVGWTRFEPTPGTASSGPTVPDWLQAAAPAPKDDKGGAKGAGSPPPPPPPKTATDEDDPNGIDGIAPQVAPQSPTSADDNSLSVVAWLGLFVLFLLFLAATPWLLRILVRYRRWASIFRRPAEWAASPEATAVIAEVAWLELRDTAVDLGYTWPPGRTPRQAAAILTRDARLGGRAALALAEVARLVERTRYSGADGRTDRARVRKTVEFVSAALGESAGRDARLLARFSPQSLRTSVPWPKPSKFFGRLRSAPRRGARRAA